MYAKNGGKLINVDWFLEVFCGKYHDLKLTQNMSAGEMGCHSARDVVPTGDISSPLDNLALAATVDKIHIEKLMEKIFQMT